MLSYHLLTQALAPAPETPARLFAYAVAGALDGFVAHADYVRTAAAAECAAPTDAALARRLALLLACDANPLAALVRAAADAEQFARRWNGINQRVALGVATVIGGPRRAGARQPRRDADADSALRQRLMHNFIAQLGPAPAGVRASPSPGLQGIAALLGLANAAPGELSAALQQRPDAGLAACAKALGCSSRTLQRQLGAAGLTFGQLRQAVRVGLAGDLLRNTRAPLVEVALAAGFYDSPHFNRAIRLSSRLSPGEYRALCADPA